MRGLPCQYAVCISRLIFLSKEASLSFKKEESMRKRTKKEGLYNVGAIEKAIEIAGGAEKLARKIETSYQTILNWKNGFSVPSVLNCVKIERLTNRMVKREDILPDYPWDDLK